MDLITLVLFFVYTWGLGFSVTKFLKKHDNLLESNLMNIGIGLATFIVLSVFLNLLHIPLDWKIFLILSGALPLFYLGKIILKGELPQFNLKITKSNIYILLVLMIFAFTFYMHHTGAFSYPYLENDDSWAHAIGAKYVSIEKTAYDNTGINKMEYMDAYPPGYDVILGVLHQTSPDLMWTMKFFNALMISLSIIFFYFFVKYFTKNSSKALFSTFVIAMVPAYLSHFIWAHSLIPLLFFVATYCLEQTYISKRWVYASIVVIAAIPLIQPTQPIKLGVMFFIYWIVRAIINKDWNIKRISSIVGGYLLAILLWWVPMIFKYGSKFLSKGLGWTAGGVSLVEKSGIIGPIGSATRLYDLKDFLLLNKPGMLLFDGQNMINNPIGIGLILFCLSIVGILFLLWRYRMLKDEKYSYKPITLLWFLFTLMGLYGGTLFPIALISFRFWMLFAIPIAILASEGLWFLFAVGKSIKIKRWMIVIVLIIAIWFTSGQQKYEVNTVQWSPGGFLSPAPGALYSFLWMNQNLPIDTPVFTYSLLSSMNAGFNLYSCEWCHEMIEYKKLIPNKTIDETYKWVKKNKYEYVMIDKYYSDKNGINETIDMIQKMISSGKYEMAYQAEANGQKMFSFVLKVK